MDQHVKTFRELFLFLLETFSVEARQTGQQGECMLTQASVTRTFLLAVSRAALGIPKALGVLWLALWVLTLPLFHIHTQTETQRGIPHSVFSADLPGEYAPPSTDSVAGGGQDQQSTKAARLASGSSYPELAFTAPVPVKDTDLKHHSSDGVQRRHQFDPIDSSATLAASEKSQRSTPAYVSDRTSRAPPRI
jgi:hypothetical protein